MEAVDSRKPGPKVGERHSGQWMPGQSGNPGGRPLKTPETRNAEALARSKGTEAVETIIQIMQDREAARRERLSAATELLNRGFGTPVSREIHAQLGGTQKPAESLSNEELKTKLLALLPETTDVRNS